MQIQKQGERFLILFLIMWVIFVSITVKNVLETYQILISSNQGKSLIVSNFPISHHHIFERTHENKTQRCFAKREKTFLFYK